MRYLVIIIAVIWIGFFIWASAGYKKRKKKRRMAHEEKPLFRSEEDLEEYAKPMKDEQYPPAVDLDDEE